MSFLREIWANKWVKFAVLVAALLLFFWLIHRLSSILTALAVAWVLAYICDPLVDRMEARRIPRTAGVALFAILLVLVIVLAELILVPAIGNEVERLGKDMPNYAETITQRVVPWAESTFRVQLPHSSEEVFDLLKTNQDTVKHFTDKVYAPLTAMVKNSVSSLLGMITFILTMVVVPVAWFFLLRDIDKINARVVELVPPRWREGFLSFMHQVDEIVSNFLHGQIIVALILAVLYSIGLWLILDIPLGLIIGLFAGFAAIVPYLGVVVGVLPALVMAFLQYQDWQHPLGVLIVFGVAQALEGNVITPKIVGDKLGLHPVVVIFAILIFAELAGLFGMLIAVPAAAIIQVLMRRLVVAYKTSELYQGGADE
ncbi:MAG TPA: AI-2E family transporter [bacterium]|nr:AI-2E family transporter [bacterium]